MLALEARDEHLLGPLGGPEVVLQDAVEELHKLLLALRLGVLDICLQRLDVVRGVVEHADEVVILVLGLPGRFGHFVSPQLGLPTLAASHTRFRGARKHVYGNEKEFQVQGVSP